MTTLPLLGVETPPTSLRFAEGANFWGIDPSTKRIALGIVQGKGMEAPPEIGWFVLHVAEMDKGPLRLRELRRELIPWLSRYRDVCEPMAVGVEQPFAGGTGKKSVRPHPQSYYVVGVTLEVLADLLAETDAEVGALDPMSWKATALGAGRGAARKSEVLGWAQQHGFPEDCPDCHGQGRTSDCKPREAHDKADAIGIATAVAIWRLNGRALR